MAGTLTGLALIALYQGHLFDFVSPSQHLGLPHSSRLLLGPGLLLLALFFGALLAEAMSSGVVARLLQYPALRTLGTYSYGMYVLHVWVMVRVHAFVLHHVTHSTNFLLLEPILFPGVLFGTLAFAFLSYTFYEKRFLALKRFFPAVSAR